MLEKLFTSKLRVKVLAYFIFHPGEAFYVRHLALLLKEQTGSIARELKNLESAELLTSTKIGNQKHYTLNDASPILEDLRRIFLKTTGATYEIKHKLSQLAGIELSFIYGSFAKGEAGPTSDIDLMIVGELNERDLAVLVSKVERKLGREINYAHYTRPEILNRMGEAGDFLHEVFAGPRILLIGSDEDALFRATQ